jgi:hypothetical protein
MTALPVNRPDSIRSKAANTSSHRETLHLDRDAALPGERDNLVWLRKRSQRLVLSVIPAGTPQKLNPDSLFTMTTTTANGWVAVTARAIVSADPTKSKTAPTRAPPVASRMADLASPPA